MRISNWLIGLAAAAIFAAAWVLMNQPVVEEPWKDNLNGLSYSAWRQDPNTLAKRAPTLDEIKQDLQLIAGKARSIRTADELHAAWPEAAYHVIPDAGHSAMEPGIRAALVGAMDRFKERG